MNKNILYISTLLAFYLVLFIGCNGQDYKSNTSNSDGFAISGHLDNISDETIYLIRSGAYLGYTFEPVDSTITINGNFSFSGKVDFPEMYYVSTKNNASISFFVENSDIRIDGDIDDLDSMNVTGSISHNKLVGIEERLAEQDNEETKWRLIKEFIQKDNETAIAPYLILLHIFNLATYEELNSFYSQLSPELKQHRYTKRIEKQIHTLEKLNIGNIAPDFVLKDTSGYDVTLSSFKGSYVLIDFWASWCGPCRKENPAMVQLYSELQMQNVPFEIVGVAADFVEDRWKKAIIKDQLPWINISDVKGFDGKAIELYGIKSIPFTVLLDKEGRIVEKGLTGEELRIKLKAIIKN